MQLSFDEVLQSSSLRGHVSQRRAAEADDDGVLGRTKQLAEPL